MTKHGIEVINPMGEIGVSWTKGTALSSTNCDIPCLTPLHGKRLSKLPFVTCVQLCPDRSGELKRQLDKLQMFYYSDLMRRRACVA